MNFFGHAVLAAHHFAAEEPRPSSRDLCTLCAGAMLPDFIGMLRLGRASVLDAVLARGIAFHHATDEVFHELDAFHRLSRGAFAWLSERKLPRGPARAVAHMGIEMLLDEALAQDQHAREAYRAALGVPLSELQRFEASEDGARLSALLHALRERAAMYRLPSAELVAERIRRALVGRPRLAMDDDGQALVAMWITTARPLVAAEAPDVLATLRTRLAYFGRAQ